MRRKKPTAEQERLLTNALDAIRQSPETYDQLTYGLGSISCNTPGCVAGHIIADNAELRNELKRKLDGEDLTLDAEYKIGTAIHEIATKALGGFGDPLLFLSDWPVAWLKDANEANGEPDIPTHGNKMFLPTPNEAIKVLEGILDGRIQEALDTD